MNPIWTIAKRELASFFDSLAAYILIVAFLAFTGLFTWLMVQDVFLRKQADLMAFFNVAYWSLFLFIPAITMRQFAEEKKTGTIELLLTKNITNRQLVVGKFLACLLMVCIALLFTLPYYVTVANIGNIDHGATICGYLALILMSAMYISLGIFASSLTNNQVVAFLLSLIIGIFFHFIFGMLAFSSSGILGDLFDTLSLNSHYDSISRGIIDTKDLIYFASMILVGIALSEINISKR